MKRSSPANSATNADGSSPALHRQGGELERRDPPLGAGLEHVDVGRR